MGFSLIHVAGPHRAGGGVGPQVTWVGDWAGELAQPSDYYQIEIDAYAYGRGVGHSRFARSREP